MSRQDEWVQGYVLHLRPFRETSIIAELLTEKYGRVSVVYRGVKGVKSKSTKARLLQPFQPLLFSWQGDRELKSGRKFEAEGAGHYYTGSLLYSALYINELLLRLLIKEDPHPELYSEYERLLVDLKHLNSSEHSLGESASKSQRESRSVSLEILLRNFEAYVLAQLGFEIIFDKDSEYQNITVDSTYRYDVEQGFVAVTTVGLNRLDAKIKSQCFTGSQLLAIYNQQWHEDGVLAAAKRLMRMALAPHLGDRPLESRQLFLNHGAGSKTNDTNNL